MPKLIDMLGQRFGRLTVRERGPSRRHSAYWWCVCDCGREVLVGGAALRSGDVRSCGCFRRERAREDGNSTWRREQLDRLNGDPAHLARVAEMGRRQVGPLNPYWSGDEVSYEGAHDRVRRLRGPAHAHACVGCGLRVTAEENAEMGADGMQWACDLDHPGTRPARDNGYPINPDPSTYRPMCWRCHMFYDVEHEGRRAPAT